MSEQRIKLERSRRSKLVGPFSNRFRAPLPSPQQGKKSKAAKVEKGREGAGGDRAAADDGADGGAGSEEDWDVERDDRAEEQPAVSRSCMHPTANDVSLPRTCLPASHRHRKQQSWQACSKCPGGGARFWAWTAGAGS